MMFLHQMFHKRQFSVSWTLRNFGQKDYENMKIGGREIVGFGINGTPSYIDLTNFPYPAVRFQEISPCYKALKEKEKGDWKALCLEEKKTLYRISFRQTFAEMCAPSGQWKSVVGIALVLLSSGVLWGIVQKQLTYFPLPDTMTDESKRTAMLRRILAFRMNPIDGISSKFDYEKDKWK